MSTETGNGHSSKPASVSMKLVPRAAVTGSEGLHSGTPGSLLGQILGVAHERLTVGIGPAHSPASSRLPIEALYPVPEAGRLELNSALRLLGEAIAHLRRAADSVEEGAVLTADNSIMAFGALLPELFACRAIGDGYAMVIAALAQAHEARRVQFFSRGELEAMHRVLVRLREEPLLADEVAVNVVDGLEGLGLPTESDGIGGLLDGSEGLP